MKMSFFSQDKVHIIVYAAFWKVVVTIFAINWKWIDFRVDEAIILYVICLYISWWNKVHWEGNLLVF